MKIKQYLLREVKIYLDDERDPPAGWILVKTPKEAISMIKRGNVTDISLDHDLGDDEKIGTGYDVLTWIEKKVFTDKTFKLPDIKIHTANPSARKRMELAVKSIYRRKHNDKI